MGCHLIQSKNHQVQSKMKILLGVLLQLVYLCHCLHSYSPEEVIVKEVRSFLVNMTTSQVTRMMRNHFQQLQLYSKNDGWAHPKLKSKRRYLLPKNLDGLDLVRLVDEMAENAKRNKYLQYFLTRAETQSIPDLTLKLRREGATVIPDVVAYAMVLNRLTGAMMKDSKVLKACVDIWTEHWTAIRRSMRQKRRANPVFFAAKTVAINKVIEDFLEALESGIIVPECHSLSLNIIQAKALDLARGNLNNAQVAVTLAMQTPGGPNDTCTGSCQRKLSSDGKSIKYYLSFPLQWADLYQTWNMAFVTNFEDWPYYLVKLLIPNVSGYRSDPSTYLFNRVLGLYIHIKWKWMGYLYGYQTALPDMNWIIPKLTRMWGKANYRSKKEYEYLLTTC